MYEYGLYSQKEERRDYLPRLYTRSSSTPVISASLHFTRIKNEKLFKRIVNALDFIRRYFKDIIGRKLGRELKIPGTVRIMTGKIPVRVFGGIAGIKILKPLAAVPMDRTPIIFCDESLEDLGDDELIFWILPHELLHLNGVEDEEFIERLLLSMNEELGFEELSKKIKMKSGYL
jgi:hypothetical protein